MMSLVTEIMNMAARPPEPPSAILQYHIIMHTIDVCRILLLFWIRRLARLVACSPSCGSVGGMTGFVGTLAPWQSRYALILCFRFAYLFASCPVLREH